MREILFRGKREDNGEWVHGDLIQLHDGRRFIVDNRFGACIDDKGNFINTEAPFVCRVLPETLSQYILMDDKKGNKIFDGAILEITSEYYNRKEKSLYKVRYHEATASWCAFAIDFIQRVPLCQKECKYYEVIGNIHDNPELLKGENDA